MKGATHPLGALGALERTKKATHHMHVNEMSSRKDWRQGRKLHMQKVEKDGKKSRFEILSFVFQQAAKKTKHRKIEFGFLSK